MLGCRIFFMKLTKYEEAELYSMIEKYISHNKVQEMKNYIQHGTISTYEHCLSVTRGSFYVNRHYNLKANEDVLIPAAMLHDFYLYDWHNKDEGSHDLHGYIHAARASRNVEKFFSELGNESHHVIESHMWPLNLTKLPRSREAWIVCLVDKYVSVKETLFCREKKNVNK